MRTSILVSTFFVLGCLLLISVRALAEQSPPNAPSAQNSVYRFSADYRKGNWIPYIGAGPAMIFIHQNFQRGRQIDFGNFDYETGFNVLIGTQNRRGTFFEMKTSLYSGPAPKLRLIIGHTF